MSQEQVQESSQVGCEVLFELFRGPHGAVHVGRMLKGIDSGRFVTLREASQLDAPKLAAIDLARSLAHPRLLKLLGVVRSASGQYLASEYVPGATLLELEASVRAAHFPLRPAVAVRIVKEALRAAEATQELLRDTAGHAYARCLFADTVWIADFGDVLLTDVVVAALLGKHPESDPSAAATKDLFAIAIQLFQLASAEVMSPDLSGKLRAYVPTPLADVLEQALGVGGRTPYASLREFLQALEALPEEFQVDEGEVGEELQRRLGNQLTQRRNKLGVLQAAGIHQDSDDVTRVFRAPPGTSTRPAPGTLRPPASAAASGFLMSDVAEGSQWQDMPTRIGQIPAAVSHLALPSDRPTFEPPTSAAPPSPSSAPAPSSAPTPAPLSMPAVASAPAPLSVPVVAMATSVRGPLSGPPSQPAPARKLPSPWVVVALLAALGGAWWAASTSKVFHEKSYFRYR